MKELLLNYGYSFDLEDRCWSHPKGGHLWLPEDCVHPYGCFYRKNKKWDDRAQPFRNQLELQELLEANKKEQENTVPN